MDWTKGIDAAAAVYGKHGIPEPDFYRRVEEMMRIRVLNIEELDWQLFDHMMSTTQGVSLDVHFEALAAAAGLPFVGVEDLIRNLEASGFLPAQSLQENSIELTSRASSDFGRLLVQLRVCTKEQIARAEDVRDDIEGATGITPALGCLLRALSVLSVPDLVRALALYRGLPYEGLDATAPRVYDASAGRHTGTLRTIPR